MRRPIIPLVVVGVLAVVGAVILLGRDSPPPGPSSSGSTRNTARPTVEVPAPLNVRFVSPTGSDDNDGSSPERALATIQQALDGAEPGTEVRLAAGTYRQDLRTVQDGRAEAPITIVGPPDAVMQGDGALYIVEVNHDHHVFQGFTIDGRFGEDEEDGYRQKLLYAQGTENGSGVTGLRVLDMTLTNALDECVRLRYFADRNEIAGNTISNCGLKDFEFGGGRKNGEGIYIGTAPEQTDDERNPTDEPDRSSDNHVHDNRITGGSECIDVKEGATANLIESNTCTGALDSDSGGIDVRGSDNVVRGNTVTGGEGAGIRLGGDDPEDGTGNDVVDNVLRDNDEGAIKFMAAPQGQVCGNTVSGSDVAVGDFADEFDDDEVTATCRGGRSA